MVLILFLIVVERYLAVGSAVCGAHLILGTAGSRPRYLGAKLPIIMYDDYIDWDEEELLRGQRRPSCGYWSGRRPTRIPQGCYDELVRRTLLEAGDVLRRNAVAASTALAEIATSPATSDGDRIRAAGMILDRVMGKAPEHITLSTTAASDAPWAIALRDIVMVGTEEQAKALGPADVIDVEVVEDDPVFE